MGGRFEQDNGASARAWFGRMFPGLFRLFEATSGRERLVLLLSLAVTGFYLELLLILFGQHRYIFDAHGHPVLSDFVIFWGTGRLALSGLASTAYGAAAQHASQVTVSGHQFNDHLVWSYPPPYFFVTSALALLPYAVALVVWVAATAAFYAATIARIARHRMGSVVALAAPWTLINLFLAQNGLLTAGLIGTALVTLESSPFAGGLVLGLLSFKPQLGVLFPFALAAGRFWRAFAWASLVTICLNVFAGLIFGWGTWPAFFHGLHTTLQAQMIDGVFGWKRLASVYAFVRALGGSSSDAWIGQVLCGALCVVAATYAWASKLPYALKAATVAALAPLFSPYAFGYDLAVLAVALAFLYRHRPFDRIELGLISLVVPSTFLFILIPVPSALFSSLAVSAACLRRLITARTGIAGRANTDDAGREQRFSVSRPFN